MPAVQVNDIDLWYEDCGAGVPLVFLHAFAVDGSMWLPQIPAFTNAGYRVICVDLCGHGRTTAPAGPYTIPQMAADVYALEQRLNLGRVCMVGLSMGGRVAMHLAIAYPDALKALVLVSTKSEPAQDIVVELRGLVDLSKQDGVYPAVAQWYSRPNYRKLAEAAPNLVKQMLEGWRGKSSDGFIGAAQAILEMEPLSSRLSEITVPTLALAGELDEPCHPYVELYRNSIPHCSEEYIPGAAHFVNVERANVFNRALLDFLAKV